MSTFPAIAVALSPTPPVEPDRARFIAPFHDPRLSRYLSDVLDWHGYIRFLGVSVLKDTGTDVRLERLFVEPLLSVQKLTPEEIGSRANQPETMTLLDALQKHPRFVVLGDPGSGKSTLLNSLCASFAAFQENSLNQTFGPLVPLPLVLRELTWGGTISSQRLLGYERVNHGFRHTGDGFLARPVAAHLRRDLPLFHQLLDSGQALLLLDGLDELSSKEARLQLRRAVMDLLREFPRVRMVITSRVVGYDEAPLHAGSSSSGVDVLRDDIVAHLEQTASSPKEVVEGRQSAEFLEALTSVLPAANLPALLHVAPFNDAQVERFASLWYRHYEANIREAEEKARAFVTAVRASPGTAALGRIPNLLTLMALIYRVLAHLPHGRARLYGKIAEAYLETIDNYRRLASSIPFSVEEKERWLGEIAFKMQLKRDSGSGTGNYAEDREQREILIPQTELLDSLRDLIQLQRTRSDAEADAEAKAFLDTIARRSGLLLPRGEGLYAFTHLSFQEYFTAVHLERLVSSRAWIRDPDSHPTAPLKKLRQWCGSESWHEVMIFLFERLHRDSEESDALLQEFFEEELNAQYNIKAIEEVSFSKYALLASLSIDPHTGFTAPVREVSWYRIWKVKFDFPSHYIQTFTESHYFLTRRLIGPSPNRDAVLNVGLRVWQVHNSQSFEADGFPDFASMQPFLSARAIKELSCFGFPLVDEQLEYIATLPTLSGLQSLNLSASKLHDLRPVQSFQELTRLIVNTPYEIVKWPKQLVSLRALFFLGDFDKRFRIDDLPDMPDLEQLGLFSIQELSLDGLIRFKKLRSLSILGSPLFTNVAPLAHMPALNQLTILSPTDPSSFAPLIGKQMTVNFANGHAWHPDREPLPTSEQLRQPR